MDVEKLLADGASKRARLNKASFLPVAYNYQVIEQPPDRSNNNYAHSGLLQKLVAPAPTAQEVWGQYVNSG